MTFTRAALPPACGHAPAPWAEDGLCPADFRATLVRERGMTIASAREQSLRQITFQRALAVFCAALALLAVQAYRGQGAGALALAATTGPLDEPVSDGALTPMPYETPGQSFPGSAYYYIAHDAEPASDAAASVSLLQRGLHWDAQEPAAELALPNSGPAARALTGLTSTIDRSRALTCLTAAIYYEAASEPDDGQRAVAQVVLNRVAHPSYPNTVCGVVYQGSERDTGCQFTFTCDGALARKPSRYFWDRAEKVAREALAGYVFAPVGRATHYHTFAVHPYWADSLNFIGQIGAHRFYRFNGPAGSPGAFRLAYAGGEPLPQPHLHSAAAKPDLANDPIALARAYEAQIRATAPQYTHDVMRHGGDAAYRATNLPGTDTVRPEYQNSGRWIGSPL
jgi:spore germination cell wall hydrolase CwlJ-like protein